MIYTWLYNLRD